MKPWNLYNVEMIAIYCGGIDSQTVIVHYALWRLIGLAMRILDYGLSPGLFEGVL